MARDFNKAIRDGMKLAERRRSLDISGSEISSLYSSFKEDARDQGTADAVLNLIGRAYSAGLAIGNRNA